MPAIPTPTDTDAVTALMSLPRPGSTGSSVGRPPSRIRKEFTRTPVSLPHLHFRRCRHVPDHVQTATGDKATCVGSAGIPLRPHTRLSSCVRRCPSLPLRPPELGHFV